MLEIANSVIEIGVVLVGPLRAVNGSFVACIIGSVIMRRCMPRGIYRRNQERSTSEKSRADDRGNRVDIVKEAGNRELDLFIKIVNNLTDISPDKDWKWAARTTLDLIEKRND